MTHTESILHIDESFSLYLAKTDWRVVITRSAEKVRIVVLGPQEIIRELEIPAAELRSMAERAAEMDREKVRG